MFDHNKLILFGGDLSCARVRSSVPLPRNLPFITNNQRDPRALITLRELKTEI